MLLFFLSEMLMLTVSWSNRSFSYFSNPANDSASMYIHARDMFSNGVTGK